MKIIKTAVYRKQSQWTPNSLHLDRLTELNQQSNKSPGQWTQEEITQTGEHLSHLKIFLERMQRMSDAASEHLGRRRRETDTVEGLLPPGGV